MQPVLPAYLIARGLLLLVLLAGAYFLSGFLVPALAALIIGLASWPVYQRLVTRCGGRTALAATLALLVVIVVLVVPLSLALSYAIRKPAPSSPGPSRPTAMASTCPPGSRPCRCWASGWGILAGLHRPAPRAGRAGRGRQRRTSGQHLPHGAGRHWQCVPAAADRVVHADHAVLRLQGRQSHGGPAGRAGRTHPAGALATLLARGAGHHQLHRHRHGPDRPGRGRGAGRGLLGRGRAVAGAAGRGDRLHGADPGGARCPSRWCRCTWSVPATWSPASR